MGIIILGIIPTIKYMRLNKLIVQYVKYNNVIHLVSEPGHVRRSSPATTLKNQVFFLDLKGYRPIAKLERNLKLLGAVCIEGKILYIVKETPLYPQKIIAKL